MKNLTKLQLLVPAFTALQPRRRLGRAPKPFYVKADVGTSTRDVELREFFRQALLPNSQIELNPGMRLQGCAGVMA